jgi:excisionase family DNA binding protein
MTADMMLNVEDVIAATRLGRTTVYALIRSGELPVVRIGRAVRIPRPALECWIEARTEQGAGATW